MGLREDVYLLNFGRWGFILFFIDRSWLRDMCLILVMFFKIMVCCREIFIIKRLFL